jgi:hypothetical protein
MREVRLNLSKYKDELFKLDNGLTVENSALLCPNPSEFYDKAYLAFNPEDVTILTGIKEATEISNVLFGNTVLKRAGCPFEPGGSTLDAKLIDVCKFTVAEEVCQYDLEVSFTGAMKPELNESNFWAHYWDVLAKSINQDIALVAWRGATAGDYNGLECDGWLDRIVDSPDTIGATVSGPLTTTNIQAAFEAALFQLPATVNRGKDELRFYVSPRTMDKIAIAFSQNNTNFYVTKELEPYFLNIKISVQNGLTDDFIILTRKYNMIYASNVADEGKDLRVRDLDIINEPVIRTRVDGKIGFHIRNDFEISYIQAV